MTIFTRPILEINLQNLLANYKLLSKLAPKSISAAVVKDDAYGLGAKKVAEFLYREGGCRSFFVAHGVEGAIVRSVAPEAEIYVLQGMGEDSLKDFQKCRLTPVISCPQQLEFWKKHRLDGIRPVIHIETGLNRLGFRENELTALSAEDKNEFSYVMSHLACADEQGHFMNARQLENFRRLTAKYFPGLPASLSASDGVFLGTEFQFDMVRLGAAMYGINTAPYRENRMQSLITVTAPVLQVEDLPEGEFVGYSATYRANSRRRIAIVSIGYGDGLPRSLSNVGKVFFKNGKTRFEARIIGRISMDNVICDITGIPDVCPGDWAFLLDENYTLDDMGRDAGTIAYEVVSRLGKNSRFDRRYK